MTPILWNPAKRIRTVDIILGLGVTFLVAFLFFLPVGFFEATQCKLYDFGLKIRGSSPTPKEVTIVAIDDSSVA